MSHGESEKPPLRRTLRSSKPAARARSSVRAAPAAPTSAATQAAPAQRKLAAVPITLRWRDLDAFNHVNNATFLTYLEQARLTWLSRIKGPWFTESYMPVVAATQINYRRQLGWPGAIVVELACERVGNSSVTIAYGIVDAQDRRIVYADGNAVLVWVEPRSGKSIALPDPIRRACE